MTTPLHEKIFTNRTLNGNKIRWIGFDMDYTLAIYIQSAFQKLCYDVTLRKLVELGYPEELLKVEYDPEFSQRALVFDKERGNVLKLDSFNFVKLALHGFKFYSRAKKQEVYHSLPIQYKDRFESADSLFHLPEIFLYCALVDFKDHNPGSIRQSYFEIFDEIRYYSDLAHNDDTIKNIVLQNMEQFIHRDPHLPECLEWFRKNEKKLFLLTNSYWDYTEKVMEYILPGEKTGVNWMEYFDAIIVGANKPDFFTGNQRFLEVDYKNGLMSNVLFPDFKTFNVYQGGNVHLFEKLLEVNGNEILYIGDHIYSDVVSSKKRRNWRTALIVEELDTTLKTSPLMRKSILDLEEKVYRLEELEKEADHALAESLDMEIRENIREIEKKFHPLWGDSFRVSRNRSRFAAQVVEFACLYTGCVSNFRHYSPNQLFRAPLSCLSHDLLIPSPLMD